MPNTCNKCSMTKTLVFICLTIFSTAIFQNNLLEFLDENYFTGFQRDSEALVLGGIIADDLNLEKKGANLGFVAKEGIFKYPENVLDAYAIFSGVAGNEKPTFSPYVSQYGIQGILLSKIHRYFGLSELSKLQTINSIILATVVVSLFFLYRRIYDNIFAIIFLLTMLSSPWLVSFARNLYWTPFLWFIPALLAAMIYIEQRKALRIILLFGIAFAVFVKSLAGYEYLSTITLFACSVFVVAPFFKPQEQKTSGNLTMFFLVFVACVVGFIGALLVHASMRGDTVLSGLQSIYDYDVKRRTYGDPSLFDPVYKASLEISPFSVVKTYVITWGTTLVMWLPGAWFRLLLVFSLGGLVYKFLRKHPSRQRDAVLLAFFFIVPVSWFVLAKGHSYIHTHLNYVLWYFGFVQALIYVSFNTAIIFFLGFVEWIKSADAKDF